MHPATKRAMSQPYSDVKTRDDGQCGWKSFNIALVKQSELRSNNDEKLLPIEPSFSLSVQFLSCLHIWDYATVMEIHLTFPHLFPPGNFQHLALRIQ